VVPCHTRTYRTTCVAVEEEVHVARVPVNHSQKIYCDMHVLVIFLGTSSIDWAQLSRFYLKTETQSSLRNDVCFK
jgi:hypothetical protein